MMIKDQHIKVTLPISKSILSRYYIISTLTNKNSNIYNIDLSTPEDIYYLHDCIEKIENNRDNISEVIKLDVNQSGTALRLLTALCSVIPGQYIIDGDEQIYRRPIDILVNNLRKIGANIEYLNDKEGYPPILIKGNDTLMAKNIIDISQWESSQYATALLLVAPYIGGITLSNINNISSTPYIKLTIAIMEKCGAKLEMNNNSCHVKPQPYLLPTPLYLEHDWSAASYWYAFLLMNSQIETITLSNLRLDNSLQGDSIISKYMKELAVESNQVGNDVVISKNKHFDHIISNEPIEIDLNCNPDLFPTLAVSMAVMGKPYKITGLSNQKNKESDRIQSVMKGLNVMGIDDLTVNNNSLIYSGKSHVNSNASGVIQSFNDHRIAMIFLTAIYSKRMNITIDDTKCIKKSYPNFINQINKVL